MRILLACLARIAALSAALPLIADSADLTRYKIKTATCGLIEDAGPPNVNGGL
jgi:hypothetical protein